MGWVDERLGNDLHDHEGYVAHALTDGTWTRSIGTDLRKTGRLRAECECGWRSPQAWDHDTPESPFPSDALEAEISATWEDHIDDLIDVTRKHRHTDQEDTQ